MKFKHVTVSIIEAAERKINRSQQFSVQRSIHHTTYCNRQPTCIEVHGGEEDFLAVLLVEPGLVAERSLRRPGGGQREVHHAGAAGNKQKSEDVKQLKYRRGVSFTSGCAQYLQFHCLIARLKESLINKVADKLLFYRVHV